VNQEYTNVMLAVLAIVMPAITLLLQRIVSRRKDTAEYSSDLLKIANDAAEALRKAREELTLTQDTNDKTIDTIRAEHEAAMKSLRAEYDGRHGRLKARIEELEKVQKIYAIQFDLVTHPNVEIRNMTARAMDDVTASQKIKAIQQATPTDEPKAP
jgi:hypothetical protein